MTNDRVRFVFFFFTQVRRGQFREALQTKGLQSGVQTGALLRRHRARLQGVPQLRGNRGRGAVRFGASTERLRHSGRPVHRHRRVDPTTPLAGHRRRHRRRH